MIPRTAKVAIVQYAPAVLNLRASIDIAVQHIEAAATEGAQLIVFPETWLTCYPAWAFGLATWDSPESEYWHSRLLEESPRVIEEPHFLPSDDLLPLRKKAAQLEVTIVLGLNELGASGRTLYNSLVTIGPEGQTLNLHRKLMPTHTEKIVWGLGDAAGLKSVETPCGRVGGLICWEHWMPLARQALHEQVEDIHVSSWPDTSELHLRASRHYAFEGGCYVLAAGLYLTTEDLPAGLEQSTLAGLGSSPSDDGVLFDGGSAIIGPDGEWIVEPLRGQPGFITATLDLSALTRNSQKFDVVGHYSREDIFQLHIQSNRPRGVTRM